MLWQRANKGKKLTVCVERIAGLKVKQVVLPAKEGSIRVKRMLFMKVKQLVLLVKKLSGCGMETN